MLLSDKNLGLIVAVVSSAILGSMFEIVTTNPTIRMYIFIGAIIGLVVGTNVYERNKK